MRVVPDEWVLTVAALSKTGGSGIAIQHRKGNPPFALSFDWRVILPPTAISLVLTLHLILPAHENYRLKPSPYFGAVFQACGFLALARMPKFGLL